MKLAGVLLVLAIVGYILLVVIPTWNDGANGHAGDCTVSGVTGVCS